MRAKFVVRIGAYRREIRTNSEKTKMVELLREELGVRSDSFCESRWSVEVDGGMVTASNGRVVAKP